MPFLSLVFHFASWIVVSFLGLFEELLPLHTIIQFFSSCADKMTFCPTPYLWLLHNQCHVHYSSPMQYYWWSSCKVKWMEELISPGPIMFLFLYTEDNVLLFHSIFDFTKILEKVTWVEWHPHKNVFLFTNFHVNIVVIQIDTFEEITLKWLLLHSSLPLKLPIFINYIVLGKIPAFLKNTFPFILIIRCLHE